ncbi:hypothetical protein [Rhizobium tibeticum]|uniref:hypothetical protein n=1 Tax=Rhizobium tibeticum TaxID=501024 RepID=UPI001428C4E6|nr:hypothetical protein [Rhizobium tibeticum]
MAEDVFRSFAESPPSNATRDNSSWRKVAKSAFQNDCAASLGIQPVSKHIDVIIFSLSDPGCDAFQFTQHRHGNDDPRDALKGGFHYQPNRIFFCGIFNKLWPRAFLLCERYARWWIRRGVIIAA